MSIEPSAYIREQSDSLAERIVARQYALQSAIWTRYSADLRAKSVRDARYHLDYLAEALSAADPTLFSAYIAWVKVLFAGLSFPDSVLPSTLECTLHVLNEALPEKVRAPAIAVVEAGLLSLADAPSVLPSLMTGESPLDILARSFLDALLAGERHFASRLILEAAEQATPIKDIYMQVFQRSQHEIGRLWQTNQISVAQEHYCTAATQMIMSQLYPYIFTGERKGPRMLVTCVGGELHEIGARMVADFFEMDGWDTYFVGSNTPASSVVQTVESLKPDILAISATMTFHLKQVRELISVTKERDDHVRVMVGGYPFNLAPELWRGVGADAYAPNAQAAIFTAERLVG